MSIPHPVNSIIINERFPSIFKELKKRIKAHETMMNETFTPYCFTVRVDTRCETCKFHEFTKRTAWGHVSRCILEDCSMRKESPVSDKGIAIIMTDLRFRTRLRAWFKKKLKKHGVEPLIECPHFSKTWKKIGNPFTFEYMTIHSTWRLC